MIASPADSVEVYLIVDDSIFNLSQRLLVVIQSVLGNSFLKRKFAGEHKIQDHTIRPAVSFHCVRLVLKHLGSAETQVAEAAAGVLFLIEVHHVCTIQPCNHGHAELQFGTVDCLTHENALSVERPEDDTVCVKMLKGTAKFQGYTLQSFFARRHRPLPQASYLVE